MDASINNSLNIKQPAPSVDNTSVQKRKINRPNVGVVDVPNISSTPLKDTLTIKKQENPKIIPVQKPKKSSYFKFQTVLSAIVTLCGIGSIINLIKKIKIK